MSNKHDAILKIFEICEKRNDLSFDNELVKLVLRQNNFKNPFDVTKLDNSEKLPKELRDKDYFIVHLGNGIHRFVKGISAGYHDFEAISSQEAYDWKYRQSLLNEYDTSESNILSVASNQRIIHDFLYDDIIASPKVYNARRTKASFTYTIGREIIDAKNLQIEIDLTMEHQGHVTVFEGKNGFRNDFAIYQLFHPYCYFYQLMGDKNIPIKEISCCYVLRERVNGVSILRLYKYTFTDVNRLDSIQLLKKAQYRLDKR